MTDNHPVTERSIGEQMFGKDFWIILRIIFVIVKALVGMNKDDVNGDLTPKSGE